jgi:hypothetical protein
MAGQKKALKRVAVVQGVNPRQCPNHGEPTEAGEPTACLDCDKAVRGIGAACWKHGEIHEPAPELLRGAPPPELAPAKPLRGWRVEIPGLGPFKVFARSRPAARKSIKKLLQLDVLNPGTRIIEIPQ